MKGIIQSQVLNPSSFSKVLRIDRAEKKLRSFAEQFRDLGGKSRLGMDLRNFQRVASGRKSPSAKLFLAAFSKTDPSQKKELLISFLESLLAREKNSREVIEFLKEQLVEFPKSSQKEEVSVYEKCDKAWNFYTQRQMRFLMENPPVMEVYNRILLADGVPRKKIKLNLVQLKTLQDLELIRYWRSPSGIQWVRPARKLLRIPSSRTAKKPESKMGEDFVLKHIENYRNLEGEGSLEMSLFHTHPDSVPIIRNEFFKFLRWIQTFGYRPVKGQAVNESVPLLFTGFLKSLSWD